LLGSFAGEVLFGVVFSLGKNAGGDGSGKPIPGFKKF
jgi:hypothetical protein